MMLGPTLRDLAAWLPSLLLTVTRALRKFMKSRGCAEASALAVASSRRGRRAAFVAGALAPAFAVAAPDFVRDVRPIFEAHCIKCHGPEKQKSSYRLDVKAIALNGGDIGTPNIVPGLGATSPLVKFIAGEVEDMRMPPKGEALAPAEIATLKAWIDSGAAWPDSASAAVADPLDWWSLKPLAAVPPPTGAENPVDAFVRAKLAAQGLNPAPAADARTLIRRLYFDLTGLPPTPEQTEAFVADTAPDAYERLVETLLASPRYGERWARHWLDVVHYGDTHGYDKDKLRPNAWPYRDYVVRAFNSGKPYARFLQEQIAGDVLFPGTADGIEALGFISAGPWDFIGHAEVPESKTDGKVARHLDRDDMVANTIGTFSSLTVHCAQCHAHKFDPIPQEDYYSLQAVFSALDRTDREYYRDDARNARFQDLRRRQRETAAALAALEAPLRTQAGEAYADITRRLELPPQIDPANPGQPSPSRGYHSALSPTPDATKWVQVDLGESIEIGRATLVPAHDTFNDIGAGFGFPVRFKVEASDDPEFRAGVKLLWQRYDQTFMADFPNPGRDVFTTGGAAGDGIIGRYVRVTVTKLAPRKDDYLFALAELRVTDRAGKNVALGRPVTALDSVEVAPRWQKTNLTDGVSPSVLSADEKKELERARDALLLGFADEPTKSRRAALLAEASRVADELKAFPKPDLVYAGAVHTGSSNFIGTGPTGGRPRPIHVLARGQVTTPGKPVGPGALSALQFAPARFALPPDAGEGERRAALARWLTDPNNPLTWRSIVNRVWHYHFGRGLVDTPNDFGRNGAAPTHPELLDWLAADFRDGGGSLKALHRRIVSSATYRQAVTTNAAAETIDSGNTLLWRQNRRKLEAEALRDAVLAASGKLDLTMGGPGWQDFVIERPEHSPHFRYDLADPEDAKTWRRSIYRFVVRSQTQPWMTSMDCADPSMRVDKRNESLSPLQALAMLNNGFIVTQARHLAARAQAERPADLVAQVARAHALALGRPPGADTGTRLVAFAEAEGLPALCRLLLNLNEFTFID
jgi:mono/diheme cytochrome c family protein/cytochrome c553